jgi:hypothetical protein
MLIRIYILTLIIILLFVKIFYTEQFATDNEIIKATDPAYIILRGLEYNGVDKQETSVDTCKDKCNQTDLDCFGYEIDTTTNTCKIITSKITYSSLKANSNKDIYMKKCHVGCTPEEQSKTNELKAQFDKLIQENKNYQGNNSCPIVDDFVKNIKKCPSG